MLQITFRNMSSSSAIWDLAQRKFSKVETQVPGHPFCNVVLEHHPGRPRNDEQYCAHVELWLGAEQQLHATVEAESAMAAVRDVFAVLDRRLASHDGSVARAAE